MRLRVAAVAMACMATAAHAESLYVIEQLVASVNALPDGSGDRVAQIKSGDRVELIERQDDQAHIRLPSGEEGWVRDSYLSDALPLQQQLNARSADLERIRKEKSQLETDLAAARRAANAASAAANATSAVAPMAAQGNAMTAAESAAPVASQSDALSTRESLSQASPPLFTASPLMPAHPTWLWALGCSLVALVVGFMLGWRMLDRRIRAKYGGLRIY